MLQPIHVSEITEHYLYLFSFTVFRIYNFLNLLNVSADFMCSGKAFHVITPAYEKDL